MPLDDAVRRAVDECIKEWILADFLRKNRAEYEAGLEDGVQQGIQQGIDKGSLETKREDVKLLANAGMGAEKIATILQVSVEDVRKWTQKED